VERCIGDHGRSDLRSLLVEGAQAILRTSQSSLAQWGSKLLGRKGEIKLVLVVAAVARKLTVAIWYLLMGRWTPVEEIDERLAMKVSKMITAVGSEKLNTLGKDRVKYSRVRRQPCGCLLPSEPDVKVVPSSGSSPHKASPISRRPAV